MPLNYNAAETPQNAGGNIMRDITMAAGKVIKWASSTIVSAPADGKLKWTNAATTLSAVLALGSASFLILQDAANNYLRVSALAYLFSGGTQLSNDGTGLLLSHWSASDTWLTLVKVGADPSAPAASQGRLFLRDNGSGKMQLAVRFPSGAVQTIATEP